jgi:predicted PurR-regulated permease PerM
MVDHKSVKRGLAGALVISIFILTFFILRPIIIPIIFGLLLAYIFTPVYKRINSKIKRKNISALILMILLLLIIVIPLIYLIPELIKEIADTYSLLQDFNFQSLLEKILHGDAAAYFSLNFNNIISQLFSSLVSLLTKIIVNLPSLSLKILVFLFTFYFAIRDNEEMKNYISKVSPFSKNTEEKILKEFRNITNAIVFGQVLIGIVTGIAFGIGMYFLGVPRVLILSFVTALVSIIPILGAWLVWFPVGIIMMAMGKTITGFLVLAYGALFVSMIDNILRPYFISKRSNLPIIVSVIGTIGGLYFLGILGIILGPLILAYVLIIIELYQQGKLNELFEK